MSTPPRPLLPAPTDFELTPPPPSAARVRRAARVLATAMAESGTAAPADGNVWITCPKHGHYRKKVMLGRLVACEECYKTARAARIKVEADAFSEVFKRQRRDAAAIPKGPNFDVPLTAFAEPYQLVANRFIDAVCKGVTADKPIGAVLLLEGLHGNGKTNLAALIARALFDARLDVKFVALREQLPYLRSLEATSRGVDDGSTSLDTVIRSYMGCHCLVLDDLGDSMGGGTYDKSRSVDILGRIIGARMDAGLPMVVTSNAGGSYDDAAAFYDACMGVRARSRLMGAKSMRLNMGEGKRGRAETL